MVQQLVVELLEDKENKYLDPHCLFIFGTNADYFGIFTCLFGVIEGQGMLYILSSYSRMNLQLGFYSFIRGPLAAAFDCES